MPLSYTLPVFEGPLDLLLFLVQKNKLNIYDIPIHTLLEQYMDTIRDMQQHDLEVATEFLDMAARLVHIKSSMLLPRPEEAEALRRELTGELIEYQLCREAAARLAADYIGGDLFIRDPVELEPDYTYRLTHSPQELFVAYRTAAGKGARRLPPPIQAFSGIIRRKIVPVSARIVHVLRRIYRQSVKYDTLFQDAQSRSEMVATFLALLELAKANRIRIEGERGRETISLLRDRKAAPEADGKE